MPSSPWRRKKENDHEGTRRYAEETAMGATTASRPICVCGMCMFVAVRCSSSWVCGGLHEDSWRRERHAGLCQQQLRAEGARGTRRAARDRSRRMCVCVCVCVFVCVCMCVCVRFWQMLTFRVFPGEELDSLCNPLVSASVPVPSLCATLPPARGPQPQKEGNQGHETAL